MKAACEKWKDELLEAALMEATTPELAEHLRMCASCAEEWKALEARKARLDHLLPQLIRGVRPPSNFHARVMAAVGASKRQRILRWQIWTLAGATVAVAVLVAVTAWYRGTERKISPEELATAQRLAEWRAPSDSLLATPGQEILKTTPRLGETYLTVPVNEMKEE